MYALYASIPEAMRTVNLWTISRRSCQGNQFPHTSGQGNQFQQDLLLMVGLVERLAAKVDL